MSTITALSGEPINNNGGATRNTFLTIGSVDNRSISNVPHSHEDKAFKAISDTKQINPSEFVIPEAGRIIRKVTATPASIFSGGSQSNLFRSVNSTPIELSSKNVARCVYESGTIIPISGSGTGEIFIKVSNTEQGSIFAASSGVAFTGLLP